MYRSVALNKTIAVGSINVADPDGTFAARCLSLPYRQGSYKRRFAFWLVNRYELVTCSHQDSRIDYLFSPNKKTTLNERGPCTTSEI